MTCGLMGCYPLPGVLKRVEVLLVLNLVISLEFPDKMGWSILLVLSLSFSYRAYRGILLLLDLVGCLAFSYLACFYLSRLSHVFLAYPLLVWNIQGELIHLFIHAFRFKKIAILCHQTSASGYPCASHLGRKEAFLVWGLGGVALCYETTGFPRPTRRAMPPRSGFDNPSPSLPVSVAYCHGSYVD